MILNEAIASHYLHGNLLSAIESAIAQQGKRIDNITVAELGALDEFHIGGRRATAHLLNQLGLSSQQHILDIGCGLGGAARFAADQYNCRISGIDLSQEYIAIGNTLCAWVKLAQQIRLEYADATAMPFQNSCFDGAYMLHVGMNISDKLSLFQEVARVLRPGALFGIYDIMRDQANDLSFPLPWATDASTSFLATADAYKTALIQAGFHLVREHNRLPFAIDFFNTVRQRMAGSVAASPAGLHLLMRESAAEKIENVICNLQANSIAPIEIIAQKI